MNRTITRVVLGVVLLGILICLIYLLYPAWQDYQHHRHKGLLIAFLLHSRLAGNTDLTKQPVLWVLFALVGAGYIMAEVHQRMYKSDKHGSAHFATRREARPFCHGSPSVREGKPSVTKGRIPRSIFVLGRYQHRHISLDEQQQASNILLTAPIGAGKSARVVIPNLLREQGSRSLFISDVKGELVRKTAGAISQFHDVWVFAPMHPQHSQGYNPLAFIRTVEEAQEFARCWVLNTGKSKEDFWPNAAIRLMTAALLHVRAAEPGAPFSRVADILCRLSYQSMKHTLTTSPLRQVREEVGPFFEYMDMNPKLIGSLMADIGTRFQLLSSDAIRAVTVHHQIDFRKMGEQTGRPIALYLSIPQRFAERYQPLLACFMMQMIAEWEALAEESPQGQVPRRIMGYLEEFANLGSIPLMNGYISTARHTGVGLLLVIQGFHQLDEKYSVAIRKNILTNTVTHLLLPGAGKEETEYYSERLGMTTVETETQNTRDIGAESQKSWTQGETGRRLMMPEELRTMPLDRMLMLSGASAPLLLQTSLYFRNRQLVELSEIPFHIVQARRQAAASQQQPQHPSTGTSSAPLQQPMKTTKESTQNKQANERYFLPE